MSDLVLILFSYLSTNIILKNLFIEHIMGINGNSMLTLVVNGLFGVEIYYVALFSK